MVWCDNCAKNVRRPQCFDGRICCSICGKVLEEDDFATEPTFVKNAAGQTVSCAKRDLHRERSGLESLFCYDKAIPEEIIEKTVWLSFSEKNIGENPCCTGCQAKGAVLCTTCSGSGLYVDSILEGQGIIVEVRCLGCGGTGNIMCSECGGRGHLGIA